MNIIRESKLVYLVGFDEPSGEAVRQNLIESLPNVEFEWLPIDERSRIDRQDAFFALATDELTSLTWPSRTPRPDPVEVERQLRIAGSDFLIALMMFDRFKHRSPNSSGASRMDLVVTHAARVLAYWSQCIRQSRPSASVFSRVPHNFADYLLLIALKQEGIPILVGRSVQIGPSFSVVDESFICDFGIQAGSGEVAVRADLLNDVDGRQRNLAPAYMKTVKQPRDMQGFWQATRHIGSRSTVRTRGLLEVCRHFVDYTSRRLENFSAARELQQFERQDRELVLDAIGRGNFVYVPLHLQPEATTSPLSGLLNDQRLFVETIGQLAVEFGLQVLVRENPKQIAHLRGSGFWQELRSLPGVLVVARSINTFAILDNARVVATLNGTAGWEAVCKGVPVVSHVSAVYQGAPGVASFSSLSEIRESFKVALAQGGTSRSLPPLNSFLRSVGNDSVRGEGLNTVSSREGRTKALDLEDAVHYAQEFRRKLVSILQV